jgi:hypothetical protein
VRAVFAVEVNLDNKYTNGKLPISDCCVKLNPTFYHAWKKGVGTTVLVGYAG